MNLPDHIIPVIIALGDFASGVVSWAERIRYAYRNNPKYRVYLLNCHVSGNKTIDFDLTADTRESAHRLLKKYPRAIVIPNFIYDLFPISGELVREGYDFRNIGFCRADSNPEYYDPLEWYEPVISEFIAVSPRCSEILAKRLSHRIGQITTRPTAVYVPEFLNRSWNSSPIRLIYAGRMAEIQKRICDFPVLVQELLDQKIDFTFDFIGSGRDLPKLQAAMDEIPHSGRVQFLKRVRPEAMEKIWAEHDVFVQVSDFEGTSNSMLEAMAQGVVPVMTNTESGVEGIIFPEQNGFLVDVGDMKALASKIARLASDPRLMRDAAEKAHEVTKKYDVNTYVAEFTEVLDKAMASAPRPWPVEKSHRPPFDYKALYLKTEPELEAGAEKDRSAPESLKNADFLGEIPFEHWTITEDRTVNRHGSTEPGKIELEILTETTQTTHIQQEIELPPSKSIRSVSASMHAQSSDAGNLGLNVYLIDGDKKKVYSRNHPGDGTWRSIEHEFEIPATEKPLLLRFMIVIRQGSTQPVRLKNVSVTIQQEAEYEPLVRNFGKTFGFNGTKTRKLLIAFPSNQRGGAEGYTITIGSAAASENWDTYAAFPKRKATQSLIADFEANGVKYRQLEVSDIGNRDQVVPIRNVISRTRNYLRELKPDCVLLELCGMQYGLGMQIACALENIPTIVVFQMVRDDLEFGPIRRWLRAAARLRNQKYVAVSDFNRALIGRAFRMPKDKIVLIPNGADTVVPPYPAAERLAVRHRIREELSLPAEAKLLITVGRLSYQKAHDNLIPTIPHILQKHPDVWFLWAGDGSLRKSLEEKVEAHGVSHRVILLGLRSDIPDLLAASDLFVFPTRFEGQPFSMLEAMAAGLPVVTTSASGILEVVNHKEHAVVCRVEDVRDLQEAIMWALENPDQMKMMASRALQRVDDFSEEKMIVKTLKLLTDMTPRK